MVFCLQNCYNKKNCSHDREKLLKFETEDREFAKVLRSLEQFITTETYPTNKDLLYVIR